jgi:hypothetical protein
MQSLALPCHVPRTDGIRASTMVRSRSSFEACKCLAIGALVVSGELACAQTLFAQRGGEIDSALIDTLTKLRNTPSGRRDAEYVGPVGELALARFLAGIDNGAATPRSGFSLGGGWRLPTGVEHFTLTLTARITVTDVAGVSESSSAFSLARLELQSALGYALRLHSIRFRPFLGLTPSRASVTTADVPHLGAGSARNLRDSRPARVVSFGIELPYRSRQSGVVIRFNRFAGTFRQAELRGTVRPAKIPYAGTLLTIGWSGPVNEIGLPWR